ncbi:hypothetical protein LR48_Vigan734s000300 [Vigna angularis]|uniref:GIR1-like zinc ribbon domain-containing protein n=1 Tax=Phaseolus angularis TaxID=3914 RepID=A0A0L9TGL5_PHAAN|nr:uncharacterized protein HKW66_Vig0188710 [Vigna angularis]KOM29631.1 hypothetical protein LR48_Vigan734s000300 [Vigna angularis]
MSDRNENAAELGLNLNLSPPRIVDNRPQSTTQSPAVLPASPSNSCVSTELNQDDSNNNNVENPNNPEAISLKLVGCPNCLMYMMINEDKHHCPRCKNTTLIYFPDDKNPVIRNG